LTRLRRSATVKEKTSLLIQRRDTVTKTLTRKALQYVVGNPLHAIRMTQHAIGASLYAPLRVLLYENDEGKACVEYDRPSSLFAQFGDDRIAEVASSLDQKLEDLAATATR
jgi:uncharacterized protein (DUF302 family)